MYGGMPLAVLEQDEKVKAKYLQGLFTNVYMKDIVERYNVKGRQYFNTIQKYYAVDLGLRNARLNFFSNFSQRTLAEMPEGAYCGCTLQQQEACQHGYGGLECLG